VPAQTPLKIPTVVQRSWPRPNSPRWLLRRGQPQAAADIVNQIIRRAGSTVQPLTVAALGDNLPTARERLPPYWALVSAAFFCCSSH
jgi:hypothetical protein